MAQVVAIDNVAQYYYVQSGRYVPLESSAKALRPWSIEDFPNIAPPWQSFFMEWRERVDFRSLWRWNATGILFHAIDAASHGAERLAAVGLDINEVRWTIHALVIFEEDNHKPPFVAGGFEFAVGFDGQLIRIGDQLVKYEIYKDKEEVADRNIAVNMMHEAIFPCLLAISLLHCKNVCVIDQEPPAKVAKRRVREQGRAPVTFKTLDIRPMQEVLRHEGGIEHNGLKKALHICRGHFATYSAEHPLFGKHTGMFYRPMHVRGSAKEGVVVKDYDVKAPSLAAAT